MNIGLVNEYFPPFAPGGAEWSTLHLGRALVARGHSVTVITPDYGAQSSEEIGGIRVVRFPYPARLAGRRTLRLRWLASPLFYLWSAVFIWRHARRARLDVIHAQNKYILPGAWLAAKVLRRPVVATLRDTLLICPFGRCLIEYDTLPGGCGRGHLWRICRAEHVASYIRPVRAAGRLKAWVVTTYLRYDTGLRRRFLERVDGVIAVSDAMQALYRQAGISLNGPMITVYNVPPPAASDNLTPAELRRRYLLGDGPIVLYVGKFSPGKGTPPLLRAAAVVVQEIPHARFVFVGGDRRQGAAAAPHLYFLGRLPNDDVLQLYRLADLVVVPSVAPESFSRVILEAMACGRPVVATRVGGTPELIEDGVSGRLVSRNSAEELARAILDLLRSPDACRKMGDAGRQRLAARFDPDLSVGRLISFYERVARKH